MSGRCNGRGPTGNCVRPPFDVKCRILFDYQEATVPVSKRMEMTMSSTPAGFCEGRSITQMMEDELDSIVDRLMTGQQAEDGRDPGRAEGVALCIAIIKNPYRPNLDAMRNEAMVRYEDRVEDTVAPEIISHDDCSHGNIPERSSE